MTEENKPPMLDPIEPGPGLKVTPELINQTLTYFDKELGTKLTNYPVFPKVEGVSPMTLEQAYDSEVGKFRTELGLRDPMAMFRAMGPKITIDLETSQPESSALTIGERLTQRKNILRSIDMRHYEGARRRMGQQRVTFGKEFLDTLEDHLADIERVRLRKRKNRRKTTKKRKQRLMGKRS